MPLSKYLKIWPCRDEAGHYFLYSTRKGSLLKVSTDLLAAARSDSLTAAEIKILADLLVWTEDPAAERQEMTSMVERSNLSRNKFHAIVVLNLDCNLACPYCYEDSFRGRFYMESSTASLLVDTVIHQQIAKGREVCIDFYGGEPLLSVPLLKSIAQPLADAARLAGTKFSFFLFTNGTLLTRHLVEELLLLGLSGALVTLDGPADVHNSQRPFVSGKGSFDLIVKNIGEVCDLIDIQLGGNYTEENYREFPLLLDHLLDLGITPERLKQVQFSPVGDKSAPASVRDAHGGCTAASDACVMEASPFLYHETLQRGYPAPKPAMGACMVEFENSIVVNYDGSLFKCPAFMGWPELSVGTLEGGIKDYSASHNLLHWQNDECLDCAYLPLCFGGCRLNPLLKNGSINEVDCRREFFDVTLEQIVLL